MGEASQVVGDLFARLAARDLEGARGLWSDGAVYHVTGSHAGAGDRGPDDYLALLAEWFHHYPDYAVDGFRMTAYDDEVVVAHLVTRGGPAPGRASGLMVFRVERGLVTEGWGIPTFAGGALPF